MNNERLQSWLQIAGLFGVVAALVFVGLQLEQTQRTAASAAYQARADTNISVMSAPLTSDALLQALAKDETGQLITITPEEEVAAAYFLRAQLIFLENEQYQHQERFVSDADWATSVIEIENLFASELNTMIWRESKHTFRQSFQEEVDRIIQGGTEQ